jgi:adenylyltransferase/sulfurtransferase
MAPITIIESLCQQIASCEAQLEDLRRQLAEAEHFQQQQREQDGLRQTTSAFADPLTHDMSYGIHDDFRSEVFAALSHVEQDSPSQKWPLNKTEYKRYGRQLIMPEIGLQGNYLVSLVSTLCNLIFMSHATY